MTIAVRFFGPIGNSSGYGNAVRNFATAFSKSGIDTKFVFGSSLSRSDKKFVSELNNYKGNTKIDFYLHGPPWDRHRSNAVYKISYFYWEADRLPEPWTRTINQVNELWVPCELVKNACLKANFKGPIKVVPTPCYGWKHNKNIIIPSGLSDGYAISDDVFKFYSIFQWHDRKGYKELLSSYYRTFNKQDSVILVLKVNPLNASGNTRAKIKQDILKLKRRLNQKY